MNIAIFGGTFNPVHNGHVEMVCMVNAELKPDLILIMPVNSPPHKSDDELTEAHHRVQMLKLAFADFDNVKIDEMELNRVGKSYTVDTLEDLAREYPGANLHLICGGDMINTLHTWHRFEKILTLATIIAIPRHNEDLSEFKSAINNIKNLSNKVAELYNLPPDISSTQIRSKLKNNEEIAELAPISVQKYISANNLYKDDIYLEFIKKNLGEKRVYHSKCVANAALKLAEKLNLSSNEMHKIYVAAILHDIFKEKTYEELLHYAEKNGIMLDSYVKNEYKLLHAPLGAHFVRKHFNADDDIVNAIKYHTTCRANATIIEQIIFIADFISDDRDFDGVEILRKSAKDDINLCLTDCLQFTIDDLKNRDKYIHPNTISALNAANARK